MEIFKLFGSVFIDDKDAMKGLDDIEKKSEKTGSNLGSMIGTAAKWGAGLAAGAGVAVGGLFALAAKVSDSASEINDMSVRTGLSTDRLQELKFATGQVGVSFDAIGGAVGKLTATMSGADAGSKAAAEAFKTLGVEVNDGHGHLKNMDDVFPEVISKLAGMSNVTDRNALAFKFFGKGAMELVPLLDAGGTGIDAMSKQAHDLGLVLSKDAVNSADTFGDTLDQVKGALGGVVAKIGVGLMPMFQSMMDWVMAHMPEIQTAIQTAFDYVGIAIKAVGTFIQDTTGFFKDHWSVIEPILIGIAAGAASFYLIIGAMKAWQIITKAATVVQLLFNGAMTANPIGLIIVAIGLLVAAGVYLYKNWDTVRLNIGKIFDGISFAVQSGMSFMKIKVLQGIDLILAGYEKLMGWVPGLGKLITAARDKVSNLIDQEKVNQSTRTLEHSMNQASYAVSLQGVELKKLESAGKDTTATTQKLAAAKQAETVITKDNTAAIKQNEEAAKKLREEHVKTLDKLGTAIITALKKRYAEKEKIEIKDNEDSLKREQKASNDRIAILQKERDDQLDNLKKIHDPAAQAIQDQIDAINKKTDDEDKALTEQEYQHNKTELEKKMSSAENADAAASIKIDLDDLVAKHERDALLESRKLKTESLRTDLQKMNDNYSAAQEAAKFDFEEKKKIEENALKLTTDRLSDEKTAIGLHYTELTTEEALQAEARKLAVTKGNDDVILLLNTYNPKWQDAGTSFGQSLIDGLESKTTSIKAAVNAALSIVSQSAGVVPVSANQSKYLTNLANGFDENGKAVSKETQVWAKAEGKKAGIPGLAEGGTILDDGTVMVGENGIEFLRGAKGATVTPLDKIGTEKEKQTTQIINNNNLSVVIPVKDLLELKSVTEFFDKYKQKFRQLGY